jgi:hypothetical protein
MFLMEVGEGPFTLGGSFYKMLKFKGSHVILTLTGTSFSICLLAFTLFAYLNPHQA